MLLVVFGSTLVAAAVGCAARAIRRARTVIAQDGLESLAVVALLFFKVTAEGVIVFLFGAAQSDPPFLAGGVYALRADAREHGIRLRCFVVILSLDEDHGSTLLQRVLVNEELVGGQTDGGIFLQGGSGCGSSHGSADSQNCGGGDTDGQHGTDAGD